MKFFDLVPMCRRRGGGEEEEGFQANAVNEVDGERDRAVGRRTELTPLGDLWVEVLAFRV